MRMPRRILRAAGLAVSGALIVAAAVLANLAAQRVDLRFDWSADQRHGLSEASRQVIAALDGPITLTAYMAPGIERSRLRERLARYTQTSDRITLVFRDPARYPERVRTLGIDAEGGVVAAAGGRSTQIDQYDEAHVTQALQRLAPGGSPWIVFVTGHGERDISARANAGYGDFAAALDAQGLRTRALNLARAGAVPNNTGVLVIASPQQDFLPGEVAMIRRFVADGGRLLWLDDPGPRYGLSPLAGDLGVVFIDGTIVYPDYQRLGTASPAITAIAQYPDTPVTRGLTQVTLFPFAGALEAHDDTAWQHAPMLRSASRSWLETGSLDGESISYQPDKGDRVGPITLGYTLTRDAPACEQAACDAQRSVVVADSDFLDNAHLATLGNRRLGLAMVQWLAGRDRQIAIDVPEAPDARLLLPPGQLGDLRLLFVVVGPLVLLALGLARWFWRRRRR